MHSSEKRYESVRWMQIGKGHSSTARRCLSKLALLIVFLTMLLGAAIAVSAMDQAYSKEQGSELSDVSSKIDPLLYSTIGVPASDLAVLLTGLLSESSIPSVELTLDAYVLVTDGTHLSVASFIKSRGGSVTFAIGNVLQAAIPVDELVTIAANEAVRYVQALTKVQPLLDDSVPDTGADLGGTFIPPTDGRGVTIGIYDTGIDWWHEDFITGSGTTRIQQIWDQTDSTGASPAGFGYGSVYLGAQINDEIDGTPTGVVQGLDSNGHGTHVASIATGDGSATGNGQPASQYVGMAPNSEILFVKGDFTHTLDGVAWMIDQAGGPLVINLSLGNNIGPHDGTSPREAAYAAFADSGAIIVVAAGNKADKDIHARRCLLQGQTTTTTIAVPSGVTELVVDIWYDGDDGFDFTLTTPGGDASPVVHPGDTYSGITGLITVTHGDIVGIDAGESPNPLNLDNHILFRVTPFPFFGSEIEPGDWEFAFVATEVGGSGCFDAWLSEAPAILVVDSQRTWISRARYAFPAQLRV